MYKVSASQLNVVRKYRDDEITLDELVKTFTTPYANQKMNIGTSFHSIIEAGRSFIVWSKLAVVSPDYAGYTFDKQQLLDFYDWLELDGTQIHEYKERMPITINDRTWLLTAKCDILLADRIIDLKTTYSSYDWETYYESPQWKVYTMVFNIPQFEYRVARVNLDAGHKTASIASRHQLSLVRSEHTDKEVIELVRLTDEIERTTGLNFQATEEEWGQLDLIRLVS